MPCGPCSGAIDGNVVASIRRIGSARVPIRTLYIDSIGGDIMSAIDLALYLREQRVHVVVAGRCFAGNAALLGCCDAIIATRGSNIGMGGPAMVEGGGLGVFAPEDIRPRDPGQDERLLAAAAWIWGSAPRSALCANRRLPILRLIYNCAPNERLVPA